MGREVSRSIVRRVGVALWLWLGGGYRLPGRGPLVNRHSKFGHVGQRAMQSSLATDLNRICSPGSKKMEARSWGGSGRGRDGGADADHL